MRGALKPVRVLRGVKQRGRGDGRFALLIKRGRIRVSRRSWCSRRIWAPVYKGQVIGELVLTIEGSTAKYAFTPRGRPAA